jgi:hypothetical protein
MDKFLGKNLNNLRATEILGKFHRIESWAVCRDSRGVLRKITRNGIH